MSAVLERNLTAGLELITGDEVALEATRYIWFAGDVIDPDRKLDLPHLAGGGEELHNVCLRRTGGFLPRCEITAMEFWGETLPLEWFPDGVRPYKLKDTDPVTEATNLNGRTSIGKPLFFMPMYPGDMIVDALGLASGERKGIIELEILRDVDYDTGESQRMQNLFFPPHFIKPIELRLIQEQIEKVADSVLDPDAKVIANSMITSCEQFRRWAQEKIDKCHTQLDTRVSFQWTYRYSSQIRSLMKQLEIEPRNQGAQNFQNSVLQAVQNSGITPEMFAQMEARDANMIAKMGEAMAEVLAKAFGTAAKEEAPAKKSGVKGSE